MSDFEFEQVDWFAEDTEARWERADEAERAEEQERDRLTRDYGVMGGRKPAGEKAA